MNNNKDPLIERAEKVGKFIGRVGPVVFAILLIGFLFYSFPVYYAFLLVIALPLTVLWNAIVRYRKNRNKE